jgi:sensor histidine kinase YesM
MLNRHVLTYIGSTFLQVGSGNFVIALFLTLIIDKLPFFVSVVYSQSIGLSICSISILIGLRLNTYQTNFKIALISIIFGMPIGLFIARLILGQDIALIWQEEKTLSISLITTLIFAPLLSYLFYSRIVLLELKATLQEEKLQRMHQEKSLTETQLRLLQAQIEPHFLFNTLSNILSLIDSQPTQAAQMLQRLTQYLRVSLLQTRQLSSTLAEEIELIRNYLDIYQLRMGQRLTYQIKLPEELQQFHLPPLLLQPLVENAIKHGLEYKIEGGQIIIKIIQKNQKVIINITDTGIGIKTFQSSGFGLQNIRQRLQSLYGKSAQLIFKQHPQGTTVILELPCLPLSLPMTNPY